MPRRVLSLVSLLVLLTTLAGSVQAQPPAPTAPAIALVYVPIGSDQDLARFQATGLPAYTRPLGETEQYLLSGADAAGRQALVQAGLSFRILDPDMAGASYYFAYMMPGRPIPNWAAYGGLLLDEGTEVLLRMAPTAAEQLSLAGVELQRVTLTPKPLGPRPEQAFPTAITPDPLIQAMMNQVYTATVSYYDRQMAGEAPVWVDDVWYTITSRQTYSGEPIKKTTSWVGQHLAALGLDVEYHQWNAVSNPNVIGELPGLTNPDDIFIICAHVDDVTGTPGADDNGSGSVAVMVAADILTQYRWGCTLRFAVWTGEEQGLLGSAAYAARARQRDENIIGVLNLDMVAWNTLGSPPGIDLYGRTTIPGSMEIAQLFADVVAAYSLNLIPEQHTSGGSGSDNSSFWAYDYAAILGIEDNDDFNPYYHGPSDTPAHTDLKYFTNFVKASIGTFAHMSGCLIPSGMGAIDGHVTVAGSGAVIPGATITAQDQTGHTLITTTDASGYYTRTLLPATYTVTASHLQYESATVTGTQVTTGTVTPVDFQLVPRGRVWGYVTDLDNGFPLAATVTSGDGTSATANPDTGYYEMYLDEGTHTVTATTTDYGPASASVMLVSGQDIRQDFALAAKVSFIPAPVHVTVWLNYTLTTSAEILNRLAGPYPFQFYEIPGGFTPAPEQAPGEAGTQAAWPGPDGFGYNGEAVDYNWVDIRATGTPIPGLSDDSSAGPFNVGFSFPFYGTNQTQFYVSSNGFLSFGGGSSATQNQCPLPDANTPNNLIAPMWDDLYPNYSSGGLYYRSFSSCPVGPGSCLVLEYYNWYHCCGTELAGTFEAILYSNGSVRMQFLNAGTESGSGSTTGIEGSNTAAGHGLTYDCNVAGSLHNNQAMCFVHPGSTGCDAAEVPWLGQVPQGGTVPAGGSLDATLLFSATLAAGVSQPGDYYATLVVNGNPKLRVPVTMTVVLTDCIAVDIITVTTEVSGCLATFNAELAGDAPFTYLWDFGPLGTRTTPAPTVDFGASGTYPYTLTVFNCGGSYSDTQAGQVTVACAQPCQAADIITVTPAVSGCQATLSATLAGDSPFTYEWDFGPLGTRTAPTPTVDFGTSGTYSYTLTVSNCGGTYSDTAASVVTVACASSCDPVHGAGFTAWPPTPTAGAVVTLTGEATGTLPITFAWDLGDDTTGSGASITHTYDQPGTYTVVMTASNCATATATVVHTLTVALPCTPPHLAGLTWAPITPTLGQAAAFTATATGTIPITFTWDFGDDTVVDNGPTITHTYAATGTFTVILTATNACAEATARHTIVVGSPPTWRVYLPLVLRNTGP